MMNKPYRSKSQYRGVRKSPHWKRYMASVKVDGVSVCVTKIRTIEEAAYIRDQLAMQP